MSLVQKLIARAKEPACPRSAKAAEIVRKLEAMPAKQARALEMVFAACGEPSARQLDAILGALPLQSMAEPKSKKKPSESKQAEPTQAEPEQADPKQAEPTQAEPAKEEPAQA